MHICGVVDWVVHMRGASRSQPLRLLSTARAQYTTHRRSILCLGDSITEYASHIGTSTTLQVARHPRGSPLGSDTEQGPGWVALLARDYAWSRRADVLNRGFGGYNSWMLLEALDDALFPTDRDSVAAVTLTLGSNDSHCSSHALHVPVDEFEHNLIEILSQLQAKLPFAQRILLSPPPCDADDWRAYSLRMSDGLDDGGGLGNDGLAPYVRAARRVAGVAQEVRFIDLFLAMHSRAGWRALLQADGLHLSAAGNAMVHALVAEALADVGRAPLDLPVHLPHWLAKTSPDAFDAEGVPLDAGNGR